MPLPVEKDLWQLAAVLIGKHGEEALAEAESRMKQALADKDEEGQRIWLAVLTAVEELARSPETGEQLN
jgi:hypothetical protein